jgi:hypothetical protein
MFGLKKKVVVDAIILFDKKANEIIRLMADEHELDLNSNNPFGKLLSRDNDRWKGELKSNWKYQFHGDACRFDNTVTGQFLDIKINRKGNYGVIDDYYLFKFVETTEELKHIIEIIGSKDEFSKILSELEKDGVIIDLDMSPFSTRVFNPKLFNKNE